MPETNGVTEARVNELINAIPQRTIPSPEQIDERIDAKLLGFGLPAGTVVAFANKDGCPIELGWKPYVDAKGKFI